MSCHVAVPSSTTLATMRCQSPLSSEALMSCVGLTLSFNELHRLSRYFSLWRPLALLPAILPVTTKFSRLCLLNRPTCPRKASCRWRIRSSSVRCTPASWNTSSLLLLWFTYVFNLFARWHQRLWFKRRRVWGDRVGVEGRIVPDESVLRRFLTWTISKVHIFFVFVIINGSKHVQTYG